MYTFCKQVTHPGVRETRGIRSASLECAIITGHQVDVFPPMLNYETIYKIYLFVSEINKVVTSRDNFLQFFIYTVFVIT